MVYRGAYAVGDLQVCFYLAAGWGSLPAGGFGWGLGGAGFFVGEEEDGEGGGADGYGEVGDR